MSKINESLILNGYEYDEEDVTYEKTVFSDKWIGAFVPFVRLFTIVIFDDYNVFVSYNNSMIYEVETIEKVKKEREILKEIGLTVKDNE